MKRKYSVWYGIDGCLPESDYPLFESDNYRECKSFIANERREFVAEFGKPSRFNLYDWYIEERDRQNLIFKIIKAKKEVNNNE